ncbi:MAG: putative porin [Bacteroidota bacterium]
MRKLLICILLASTGVVYGQITDDSTELVYGPETSLIIKELDIKNNFPTIRHPDTTMYGMERFTWTDKLMDYYQDLGNSGTALYPVFPQVNETIGKTAGYNAFDVYMVEPEEINYYDTKSPFMDLEVVFGGGNRAIADFNYSRNINERWNVGFDIYRVTSDKQIGYAGIGDRNVVGTTFDIYSYYKHNKLPYTMLINLANMSHNTEETGGILIASDAPAEEFFQYKDSEIRLVGARAYDKRIQGHLYHEFDLVNQLQVYHQLDLKRKRFGYSDFNESGTLFEDFYGQFLIDPDSTYENTIYRETVNEAGIKGDLANLFYRLYIKSRLVDLEYLYFDPTSGVTETYLGGYGRFDWKEKFNVEAMAEFLQSGEYKLIGKINSDLIFGSYKSVLSKPSFLVENYFANNHEWHNNFKSPFTNEVTGGINVKTRNFKIKPSGKIMTLNNFIYYDQNINPAQAAAAAMFSVGGDFNLSFYTDFNRKEGFHIENEVYYTELSGSDADKIRLPKLFYNGRAYWTGFVFKNTMGLELGVDMHAKTGYKALTYAPEIQQFYLQDDFNIDAFIAVDAFLIIRVDKLRAFVKFTHVNQPAGGGYFTTPYYPGEQRMIGLGGRWLFFD